MLYCMEDTAVLVHKEKQLKSYTVDYYRVCSIIQLSE